ncbi:MAG: tannase/feruloyl esterase family alpha/beta hydrolase [Desulfobacteraceae bacterium]|nr:tannase/feruloyl esterase family alpha/beta hydrolase [Desulfobacteraceae bacterium]
MRVQHLLKAGLFIFLVVFSLGLQNTYACKNPNHLVRGLMESDVIYYSGDDESGGLAHINYWTIDPNTLPDREKQKARRIQANRLHSTLYQPHQVISGYESTGILDVEGRKQWITLKLPDHWNGKLVVCGTPGLRNEYANEAMLVPWLLADGYAVVSGNKGLDGGMATMLSGTHPSRHWGRMMHDMARWAKHRLIRATHRWVHRVYAVGLSNGGYQVRRALEIDNDHPRRHRMFHGGLDWSGTYFADRKTLDTDRDGEVSMEEYAAADTLVKHMDTATLNMGWAYSPDTLTTPAQYEQYPRYPSVRPVMQDVGFNDNSDIFWGFYNTNYDAYKNVPGYEHWKGVGYQNLISYVYRAELLGDDAVESAVYSCFADPGQPDLRPPLYDWLEYAVDGGWTDEGVASALANANTAKFRVPMITIVGDSDGLLAMNAHSIAYRRAIEKNGKRRLHRLYVIENGPHVDAHADGLVDFNFDGIPGNEGAADELTPMQAYAQRAFMYLEDWVEHRILPPAGKTVPTDPVNDISDPYLLEW